MGGADFFSLFFISPFIFVLFLLNIFQSGSLHLMATEIKAKKIKPIPHFLVGEKGGGRWKEGESVTML